MPPRIDAQLLIVLSNGDSLQFAKLYCTVLKTSLYVNLAHQVVTARSATVCSDPASSAPPKSASPALVPRDGW